MTRFTIVAFALLTGLFYMIGRPADNPSDLKQTFSGVAQQGSLTYLPSSGRNETGDKTANMPRPVQMAGLSDLPGMPTRNPQRVTSKPMTTAQSAKPRLKQIRFGDARLVNGDQYGRAKMIPTAGKSPLIKSYGQRFSESGQAVLGPRLTVVLMKRELRRVGCYDGAIDEKWNDSVKSAIGRFNKTAGTNVKDDAPAVASLKRLQRMTDIVCRKAPPVGRAIIAQNSGETQKALLARTSNEWRTKTNPNSTKTALPISTYAGYKSSDDERAATPAQTKRATQAKKRKALRRKYAKRKRAAKKRHIRLVGKKRVRKTRVRGWKRRYKRKKFGFRNNGGTFSLD